MPRDGADDGRAVRDAPGGKRGTRPLAHAFEKSGNRCGARGFDENAFVAREPALGIEDFQIGHDVDRAA